MKQTPKLGGRYKRDADGTVVPAVPAYEHHVRAEAPIAGGAHDHKHHNNTTPTVADEVPVSDATPEDN